MKILYCAGPYRADGDNNLLNNILTARYIARQLWLRGYAVICPHMNNAFMDGPDTTFEMFMAGDLAILEKCDAIYLLPGWCESQGANIEFSRAVELGMDIYYHLGEVPYEKSI